MFLSIFVKTVFIDNPFTLSDSDQCIDNHSLVKWNTDYHGELAGYGSV